MEQVAGGSTLEALYREASIRRQTAENIQAEVLAAESARRDASKVSASSALMTSLRLSREVARVFKQHSLADTGLLTRAQLQAALHSLGLLASKPPAFSSSMHRPTAAHPSIPCARHSHQEGSTVDSLWQLLTGRQSNCTSATPYTKASTFSSHKKESSCWRLQPEQAAGNKADSCDSLLSEGLDLWQQLMGDVDVSLEAAHAVYSPAPTVPLPANAAKPSLPSPLPVCTAESMCSTTDQPAQPKVHLQLKEVPRSSMHGVSLQQLLSFVQLVQQHSSGSQTVQPAPVLQATLTQRQNAALDRMARMCSQNKQANMAYVGIGNRRVQQQLPLQLRAAHAKASGMSTDHAMTQGRIPEPTNTWHLREHAVVREATALASRSVRFSRRNFKHQQKQQQQPHLHQSTRQPGLGHSRQVTAALSSRHKPSGLELGKQHSFAQSKSTAADMLRQRQALAELEMAPCTFHPALNSHSLALVAAKASAYQPPQKAAVAHRQIAYIAELGMHISSVSSTGVDSGQEADIAAESAGASPVIGPDAFAHSPIHYAFTSREIQEERALKECTFAPRLNANKAAKSIVAQTWKSLLTDSHQHGQQAAAISDKSDTSQATPASADDDLLPAASAAIAHTGGAESAAAASAAMAHAGGDKGGVNVISGAHKGTQGTEHQAATVVKTTSSLRRAQRRRQLGNSYAAAAQRNKGDAAAVCCAVPTCMLQQQQHVDSTVSESEAQLQAEVAGCDRRLEQCIAARQKDHVVLKAVSGGPTVVAARSIRDQQDNLGGYSNEGQLQQSALTVIIEAELADGSASRFEVQQADQLRHLTKYFATLMELQSAHLPGQPQFTLVA